MHLLLLPRAGVDARALGPNDPTRRAFGPVKHGGSGFLSGKYSITLHVARRHVEIVFTGLWSVETVEAYRREREATTAALAARGCPFASCTVLVDARGLNAQPLDSIAAFAKQIGGSPDQPRRSALIVASALFRMQNERLGIPNQRVFEDRAAAMTWLTESETAAN